MTLSIAPPGHTVPAFLRENDSVVLLRDTPKVREHLTFSCLSIYSQSPIRIAILAGIPGQIMGGASLCLDHVNLQVAISI